MSTDTSFVTRSREENWQPILELSIEEVFEIMVGTRVKPVAVSEHQPDREFTAMVGLTGALCGILTICCGKQTAHALAKAMLGAAAQSEQEAGDALGEICNMVTGNFESGSAKMKTASEPTFDRIANALREGGYRLRIEGHTDNIPIHNPQFPSNWELSTARSTEVVRLLIIRNGFAADRLSAAGYAEYHPAASNRTAEGRSANRRVDVIVLFKSPGAGNAEAENIGPQNSAVGLQPGSRTPNLPSSNKPSPLQPRPLNLVEGRLPH